MKKTIRTVLIFALVMAVLLGVSMLAERMGGGREAVQAEEKPSVTYEMDERGATVISLLGQRASVSGRGARWDGSAVSIMYPGTYRLEGSLDDGQILVDLGDFDGDVYLIMNDAQVTCSYGPALYIEQADETIIYLPADTTSTLTDGTDYLVVKAGAAEGEEPDRGAAIFSRDDLIITGEGALSVVGNAADGIRSKDELTVSGGSLLITSTDDGLQAGERLTVEGGSLLIGSGGDGLSATQGSLEIAGGSVSVNSVGDAMTALADLTVSGGSVSVTAYGGADLYAMLAMADGSAKGMKGENISITGGSIKLDTADDCLHAAGSVSVTGGSITLLSGDDAIRACGELSVRDVAVTVQRSYEGLEAESLRLKNVWLNVAADKNAVDAGAGGLSLEDGTLFLTAPRAVSSDGPVSVARGYISQTSAGTDSLFSADDMSMESSTYIAYCRTGTALTLLETGELPGSLLFVLPSDVPAGTTVALLDPSGQVCCETVTDADGGALFYAGWWLNAGQTYTLTAGEYSYEAEVGEGCTVTQPAVAVQSGGWGWPSRG